MLSYAMLVCCSQPINEVCVLLTWELQGWIGYGPMAVGIRPSMRASGALLMK